MRRGTAIGINDDLAPGQPGVAIGAADLERAGRVDVPHRLIAQKPGRQNFADRLPDIGLELGLLLALVVSGGMLRSEEHTSELQSLMRISYAVFCLQKKKNTMST